MVINTANKVISGKIGLQNLSYGVNYIKSPYLKEVTLESDNLILIYNTLTSEIIKISKENFNNPDKDLKKMLCERWYYLPENANPKIIADMFKQVATNKEWHTNKIIPNSFVIMTTSVCNAKCFYCYESDYCQKPMSEKVALDTAKFLVENYSGKLHISWFGGEPLCSPNVIRIICSHLKKNGINFTSSIISNGYLIDTFEIDEIKNDWNLKRIQITVDGTKDIYNTTKNYKNKDPNAFEKVINNIKYLLDNDIKVTIRMNIGIHNGDDVLDLINYLYEKFGNYEKFGAYPAPLYIGAGDPPLILTDEETLKLFNNVKNVYALLKSLNIHYDHMDIVNFKGRHCMADSGSAKLITPDGNFTPCEHHAFDHICGNIYDGINDFDELEIWKETLYKPECDTCFYYPKCKRLVNCPNSCRCDLPHQKLLDYRVNEEILSIYDRYLATEKEDNE